jgi:YD repeat-containing protein
VDLVHVVPNVVRRNRGAVVRRDFVFRSRARVPTSVLIGSRDAVAHDGSVTFLAYDARGRETERAVFPASYSTATTRPALANATRVVSTKWHATFNLPTQVAEPNKTTAKTYNSKGMLTGQSWTATTDATGAAKFTAVKTGSTYATGWGYNSSNVVTSAVRKSDGAVVAQMTYTVNAQGSATKATNVLSGQSTTSATYDPHGRLISETDPFGTTTTTYSARGFVQRSADEAVTTNVTHNPIGLVTEVSTGTGFTLRWAYKPDHTVEAVTINGSPLQIASVMTRPKKTPLDFLISTAFAQSGTIVLPPPRGGIGLRGGGVPGICRAVMHEIGRRLLDSVSTDETCDDEKKQCDPCDQVAENLGWTNHGRKHVPKKNIPWPDVVRGTATADAKYTHNVAANDVAQRAFEMAAWNRGTPSNKRKRWRFMKFDFIVGAKAGVETVYMRIECTDPGVIHGHQVTPEEYREHVGKL